MALCRRGHAARAAETPGGLRPDARADRRRGPGGPVMSFDLPALRDCFEGIVPSSVATLDAEGMPNISFLSQVYLVDDHHVALSNQFFSKTVANVRETRCAAVMVVNGRTGAQHVLDLAYEGSLGDGPVFER